ncbi:MAG TPA: 23S rRNA pseudouridine(2604) synthase RluF [Flavobacteriaceae bacterium]|nr:23S rRNA pseudouridine(2604) synthase RluF [Flavobacteriaceae bacterium]MCB9212385.1 23S rRNA pseudouridine(2604) synthase RluF [Alteromonas sp.]HPF11661.1 23S rRNA pseudouridine(2604) synthase RluF [Flavobacteriaceae bacterium]HQU20136.1 23S rRNA pseudouridine(2604) synthase RluF [Flavobacteriaceae bacterium]HQU64775.1 23S rRNA pseudouridine(2604) synthase RluF [Flavobacteriaceae bacterium]
MDGQNSRNTDSIRLNKAISDSGFCSRRQADTYIEKGLVTLNGKVAGLGDRVIPSDEIRVAGQLIKDKPKNVYIAFNKPIGVTTTTDSRIKGNVIDLLNLNERVFYIGRLDKPSEGLLLLTNDGDIVNKILRAGNEHEKEYLVEVNRPITDDFLQHMRKGVPILDTITKKCEVEKLSKRTFKIVLIQGLNRQIRRMCEALGYEVIALKRIRVMNVELGDLPVGKWRYLSDQELKGLQTAIKDSENRPYTDVLQKKLGKRRSR